MTPRVLLDTHILVRWLADPKRLSRDQARILDEVIRRRQTVAISAITLLELALLSSDGPLRMKLSGDEVFNELEASPVFRILPLTLDVAKSPRSSSASASKVVRNRSAPVTPPACSQRRRPGC